MTFLIYVSARVVQRVGIATPLRSLKELYARCTSPIDNQWLGRNDARNRDWQTTKRPHGFQSVRISLFSTLLVCIVLRMMLDAWCCASSLDAIVFTLLRWMRERVSRKMKFHLFRLFNIKKIAKCPASYCTIHPSDDEHREQKQNVGEREGKGRKTGNTQTNRSFNNQIIIETFSCSSLSSSAYTSSCSLFVSCIVFVKTRRLCCWARYVDANPERSNFFR